ncbi:GlmU family protein [Marivirga sp. S37H4]|uniref:GlmU family protein n=1 Tax=Marivirga aurantiaca TaxID=2802615 RepID=A0A934WYU3_9BACT|nr:GlmU family protein [Marivirga aurantiaca]MBK6265703.1 GlmU family protein [Marivirga aurantiaca]
MNYLLIEQAESREKLKPFTFTRPIAEIRVGILTIREKWEKYLKTEIFHVAASYLQGKFPRKIASQNTLINSSVCPTPELVKAIQLGATLKKGNILISAHVSEEELAFFNANEKLEQAAEYDGDLTIISEKWHIFQNNGKEIKADFELITHGRNSVKIEDPHTIVYNGENIFVEKGAVIKAAILNAENGPIYIGKNAYVNEGAIIKGPFALGEGSHVNMGAVFKGDSTVGPFCKVGGEVSNTIFFGYSNKGHDGFIGNSVIGEWCNLGAATNTSNLKNNYANVKLWDYGQQGFVDTGQQFCGLMMGDHSKSGINTMFNTGTVVGVCANVFGSGFPRNFIPSFAWGGASGFTTFRLEKALEIAKIVMKRRDLELGELDQQILNFHFEESASERFWEN